MFVDQAYDYSDWIEIYDSNMQLWKVIGGRAAHVVDIPQIGRVVTNSDVSAVWDVQNDHVSYFSSIDKAGRDTSFNQNAPAEYNDFTRFSTPAVTRSYSAAAMPTSLSFKKPYSPRASANDDGHEVEIASGVSARDMMAVNVGEGVEEGDPVQPVVLAAVH